MFIQLYLSSQTKIFFWESFLIIVILTSVKLFKSVHLYLLFLPSSKIPPVYLLVQIISHTCTIKISSIRNCWVFNIIFMIKYLFIIIRGGIRKYLICVCWVFSGLDHWVFSCRLLVAFILHLFLRRILNDCDLCPLNFE